MAAAVLFSCNACVRPLWGLRCRCEQASPVGGPWHNAMEHRTRRALEALARALAVDPDGARELMTYGHIPVHLVDALDDLDRADHPDDNDDD